MPENLWIVAAKWKENAWTLGTFFVDIRHLFVDIRFFSPTAEALGSSAIVKVSEQTGAAPKPIPSRFPRFPGFPSRSKKGSEGFPGTNSQEQVLQARISGTVFKVRKNRFPSKFSRNMFYQAKQGSQNRVSSKCFQEEVSRKRFPSKVPSKFPKQDFQEHVFPSKTKFPGQVFKQVFPEEVSRKRCQSKVPSKLVPKQGFQEEVPKQGSQPQVPRNRCPYKVPKNRFTRKVSKHVPKQGSQQQVPRNRFPNKFPKNRFTSKVAGKSSQAMFPGKGSQARFPGTASQARLLGRGSEAQGSQEEVRKQGFPVVPGNFAWEPALPGDAYLRTFSCEPCSCLEPCLEFFLETVPGTLLGNRYLVTVLAIGS